MLIVDVTGVVETCGITCGDDMGTFPFIGCDCCWVIGMGNKLTLLLWVVGGVKIFWANWSDLLSITDWRLFDDSGNFGIFKFCKP